MIKKLIELGLSYENKDIEEVSPLDLAMDNATRGGYHYQIFKMIQWYKENANNKKEKPIMKKQI